MTEVCVHECKSIGMQRSRTPATPSIISIYAATVSKMDAAVSQMASVAY